MFGRVSGVFHRYFINTLTVSGYSNFSLLIRGTFVVDHERTECVDILYWFYCHRFLYCLNNHSTVKEQFIHANSVNHLCEIHI